MTKPIPTALVGGILIFRMAYAAAVCTQEVVLEEPAANQTYAGIANLRGWAVGPNPIDRVEMYIDAAHVFDVPYGATRLDVGAARPDCPGSSASGFSMAFSYSNLVPGVHTFTARAVDHTGLSFEDPAQISVIRFGDIKFVTAQDLVSVDGATLAGSGDSVSIGGLKVKDKEYDVTLTWNTASQSFATVRIVEKGSATLDLRGNFAYERTSFTCPGKSEKGTLTSSFSNGAFTFGLSTSSRLNTNCSFSGAWTYISCTAASYVSGALSVAEMATIPAKCTDPIYSLFFSNVTILDSDEFIGGGNYSGAPGGVEVKRQ